MHLKRCKYLLVHWLPGSVQTQSATSRILCALGPRCPPTGWPQFAASSGGTAHHSVRWKKYIVLLYIWLRGSHRFQAGVARANWKLWERVRKQEKQHEGSTSMCSICRRWAFLVVSRRARASSSWVFTPRDSLYSRENWDCRHLYSNVSFTTSSGILRKSICKKSEKTKKDILTRWT